MAKWLAHSNQVPLLIQKTYFDSLAAMVIVGINAKQTSSVVCCSGADQNYYGMSPHHPSG